MMQLCTTKTTADNLNKWSVTIRKATIELHSPSLALRGCTQKSDPYAKVRPETGGRNDRLQKLIVEPIECLGLI